MSSIGHRTVLAQQAMDASDVIHMTFSKRVVGTDPPRKLLVQVPDGPSTDGGKKARQSITLAPEDGTGASVMCGWLDVGRHQAELRSFETVAEQFESRFGHAFDVTIQEYRDLMQELERTLRNLQVQTTFVDAGATPGPGVRPARATGGTGGGRALLLTLVALGAAGAVAFFLLQ